MPTIDIRVPDDETGGWKQGTVEAIETSTPGLVVNRAQFLQPGYTRWWTATHFESGLHLPAYFPNPEQAIAFADNLNDVTDWTRPAADMRSLMDHGDARVKYRRAMDRNGGVFAHQLEPDDTTAPAAA